MSYTPTGVVYLTVYAFIVQVVFINLLIGTLYLCIVLCVLTFFQPCGIPYAAVGENADMVCFYFMIFLYCTYKEWKYYHCGFVRDSMSTSALPPPLNLLAVFQFLWK